MFWILCRLSRPNMDKWIILRVVENISFTVYLELRLLVRMIFVILLSFCCLSEFHFSKRQNNVWLWTDWIHWNTLWRVLWKHLLSLCSGWSWPNQCILKSEQKAKIVELRWSCWYEFAKNGFVSISVYFDRFNCTRFIFLKDRHKYTYEIFNFLHPT